MFSILNRYFLKDLVIPFCCCFLGFIFIFLLSSIHNDLKDFATDATTIDIISYFIFLLPNIINNFLPMSLLLGTIYCLSSLSHNHEIVACRAAGISLVQMSLPLIIFALFLCSAIFFNNEFCIPYTQKRIEKIKGEMNHYKSFSQGQFTHFNNEGKRQWTYDNDKNSIINIYLYQTNNENVLQWDLYAKKSQFNKKTSQWKFIDGVLCFYKNGIAFRTKKFDDYSLLLKENIKILLNQQQKQDDSSIRKLLIDLEFTTKKSSKKKIKTSLFVLLFSPFMPLIAILLAIPLSVTNNRYAKATTIASSIPLMIAFFILSQGFVQMGYIGLISPFLAGAIVPLSFMFLGGIFFYKKN